MREKSFTIQLHSQHDNGAGLCLIPVLNVIPCNIKTTRVLMGYNVTLKLKNHATTRKPKS